MLRNHQQGCSFAALLVVGLLLLGSSGVSARASGSVYQQSSGGVRCSEADVICLVSISLSGGGANGDSFEPAVSADGRFVAFHSYASNLVPGDTNGTWDVFVHDRQTGQTNRISVGSDGLQANAMSLQPSISADGRFVAFRSYATNLVPGDIDGEGVFVYDRSSGQTSYVSVSSGSERANREASYASISADGRFVAFHSYASNLVPGDTNGTWDVFVHDRQTGQTNRISVGSDGLQANGMSLQPSISADGRFIAFSSEADNLVPSDTNGWDDIFVHDRQTGQTSRVSVSSDGAQADRLSSTPALSANGRFIAFMSLATNLVPGDTNGTWDIFVHDRQTGQTSRVSVSSDGAQANNESRWPSLSADGRFVAFRSLASNLVPEDTNNVGDIFVHDLQTGQTSRVSVSLDGSQANRSSDRCFLSADGRFIAFESNATNLVTSDTNNAWDVFIIDWQRLPS